MGREKISSLQLYLVVVGGAAAFLSDVRGVHRNQKWASSVSVSCAVPAAALFDVSTFFLKKRI
jgi:hypothetical protein